MASSAVHLRLRSPGMRWLRTLLVRAGGTLLVLSGVFVGLALFGHDPRDPSFNTAGGGAVVNPTGLVGAYVADLLYQTVGLAAWLLPAACISWGIRLSCGRSWRWPWLPLVSLPLALLAVPALLATLEVPEGGRWPFRVGIGGVIGDVLRWHFQPMLGERHYLQLTVVLSVLLGISALGLRWGESLRAMAGMLRISTWLGRHVGRAATAAAGSSGQLLRGRLPGSAAAADADAEEIAEEDPERIGWLTRFARWLHPEDLDVATSPLPSRRGPSAVRRAAPAAEPVSREDPAPAPARPRRRPRKKLPPEPPEATDRGGESFPVPSIDLLEQPRKSRQPSFTREALEETSRQLESVLDDFGVRGEIVDARPGPVVTLFELDPAPGTRAQRVINLADDIARSLCALSVRVATIPGRKEIGIEVPNPRRQTVYLRELLETEAYRDTQAPLPLALGKDIAGRPVVTDLSRMPHLLIAGTTGSGKSVAINAMILSLLFRLHPEQCRMILIDPKVIELAVYEDIPHLLAPVVTEPHKAVVALKWVVRQMDERYRLMSHMNVRDIASYNRRIVQARKRGEQLTRKVRVGFEPGTGSPIIEEQPIDMNPLPLIVVVVDEVADLMMTAGKEIEHCIQRLSQKARAAGIHLIVATQRPSVDVLTGVIKSNLPSRISFRVSSKIDSRTILGEPGAEQLLGQGDMLYLMPGDRITRIHGPLVTDEEVERVVAYLREQGEPDYLDEITNEGALDNSDTAVPADASEGQDGLYQQAVQIVARDGKASTSYLQRKLQIGYNTAARLIERMESEGLISAADHVGRRQVFMGRGGVDGTEPTDHL